MNVARGLPVEGQQYLLRVLQQIADCGELNDVQYLLALLELQTRLSQLVNATVVRALLAAGYPLA